MLYSNLPVFAGFGVLSVIRRCKDSHLVDLPPDKEDDCKEVEDDQGGDEDGRLSTIVPGTLPPPSLQGINGIKWREKRIETMKDMNYLCMVQRALLKGVWGLLYCLRSLSNPPDKV